MPKVGVAGQTGDIPERDCLTLPRADGGRHGGEASGVSLRGTSRTSRSPADFRHRGGRPEVLEPPQRFLKNAAAGMMCGRAFVPFFDDMRIF
ncbi:MAG: hypothetical protein IJ631_00700 [Schwartzia sp.]|nr:hypothetical protein [Schwartzia sp. (in: firmicutes)]